MSNAKKVTIIVLSLLMAVSLCACAGTASSGASTSASTSVSVTPSPSPSASKSPSAIASASPNVGSKSQSQSQSSTAASDSLESILSDISTSYEVGTAGSSLKAAIYAGRLLDWNATAGKDASAISSAAGDFHQSLGSSASADFGNKLSDVYYAAVDLCGSDAKDLLNECGYEARSFPWNSADMTSLFTALYQGVGLKMPAAVGAAS